MGGTVVMKVMETVCVFSFIKVMLPLDEHLKSTFCSLEHLTAHFIPNVTSNLSD